VLDNEDHRTDMETMLYYRNRALWSFMLMSLLRKGEVVRIRVEDIDQRSGIIYLIDRPEDNWLGDLKTGPDEIFVTSINPLWKIVNSWLTEGRWIAEKMLRAEGREDHGKLFCNRNGGPLTQHAVDSLFRRLKEACGFPKSKPFSPHITRHTMASLMINSGVQLTEVQQQLRHAYLGSTEVYAKVCVQGLRESMNKFWQAVSM
jgi:site-specific recombinase XerD